MTNSTQSAFAVNAAKIGGITTVVPLLFSAIPEPWSSVISGVIIICGGVTAAIQPPQAGSKWMFPYQVVSVIGLNIGWAVNHIGARVEVSQGLPAQASPTGQDKHS
ncbi:hypothetical protein Amal_03489 [Acetobacter malorum]|uniref:Uncharacterized protein n=1 Tax=Acetobacter malorum TaxID=178901 RepID=A0A177G4R5_9PROT|nr:hypothetical protein [Acetobacter malorum]OAG75340.1 hypothetical protein Amal_03489 [Acetobacter malorum]